MQAAFTVPVSPMRKLGTWWESETSGFLQLEVLEPGFEPWQSDARAQLLHHNIELPSQVKQLCTPERDVLRQTLTERPPVEKWKAKGRVPSGAILSAAKFPIPRGVGEAENKQTQTSGSLCGVFLGTFCFTSTFSMDFHQAVSGCQWFSNCPTESAVQLMWLKGLPGRKGAQWRARAPAASTCTAVLVPVLI